MDYYPFGKEARGSSSANEPKEQFTCKERDAESGSDYFGARYYNSSLARFLCIDPLASTYPQWSPYVYAGNMPVHLIDVDGRGPGLGSSTAATPIIMYDFYRRNFPNATAAVGKIAGGVVTAIGGATALASTPLTAGAGASGYFAVIAGFTSASVGVGDLIQAFKGKSETAVFMNTGKAFGLTEKQVNLLDLALAGVSASDAVSKLTVGMKSADLAKTLDALNSINDVGEVTKKNIENLRTEVGKQLEERKQAEEKKKQEEEKKMESENK